MPSRISKRGRITLVCPNCGYVFSEYSLQREPLKKDLNKFKFAGAPMPIRAKYEGGEITDGVILCPSCGVPLLLKIGKFYALSIKQFDKNHIFDYRERRYISIGQELVKPVDELMEDLVSGTDSTTQPQEDSSNETLS